MYYKPDNEISDLFHIKYKLLFNSVSTSDIELFSVCNGINTRKIVEDFIQVIQSVLVIVKIMLIPNKNYDKCGSKSDNLIFSCFRLHVVFNV